MNENWKVKPIWYVIAYIFYEIQTDQKYISEQLTGLASVGFPNTGLGNLTRLAMQVLHPPILFNRIYAVILYWQILVYVLWYTNVIPMA